MLVLNVPVGVFLDSAVISTIVSVESTESLCSSSCEGKFYSYIVAWKWQWHYPETDLVQSLWGQPRQPPVHRLTLLAAHIEQNTNWQLGLRGTTLEGWEAGKLIPQLYVVRWALEGWRDEWSVSREERRRKKRSCAEFTTSCQAKEFMNNRCNQLFD